MSSNVYQPNQGHSTQGSGSETDQSSGARDIEMSDAMPKVKIESWPHGESLDQWTSEPHLAITMNADGRRVTTLANQKAKMLLDNATRARLSRLRETRCDGPFGPGSTDDEDQRYETWLDDSSDAFKNIAQSLASQITVYMMDPLELAKLYQLESQASNSISGIGSKRGIADGSSTVSHKRGPWSGP